MSKFTTRIELFGGGPVDYCVLHEEMACRGFSKFLLGSDGQPYELPTGEYDYEGDVDPSAVLDLARAAANATGLDYAVLVTLAVGRVWSGLVRAPVTLPRAVCVEH